MLRSLKDLERYDVSATDGDVGVVLDFLIDDERWIVRYLVVQTGGLLTAGGRRVLISPISFREVDWTTRRFHLALTSNKVRNSPSVDMDEPVSRQREREYYLYYGYPQYWGSLRLWGLGGDPGLLPTASGNDAPVEETDESSGDVHLRSVDEVRGYHVQGSDGGIGHVEDFIVDDETWEVRYLVVDTSNWWFGKKVLVAPQWANRISWSEKSVHVDMSRKEIKGGPEWSGAEAIDREYESGLYDYYGRPVYWGSGDRVTSRPPSHSASDR